MVMWAILIGQEIILLYVCNLSSKSLFYSYIVEVNLIQGQTTTKIGHIGYSFSRLICSTNCKASREGYRKIM
jgi:hypothetical protein